MAYRKLEIGDRVVVTRAYGSALQGMTGTVCYFRKRSEDDRAGVMFDEKVKSGHTLDGNCPAPYGWFTPEGCLEIIEDRIGEPDVEQNDIMALLFI